MVLFFSFFGYMSEKKKSRFLDYLFPQVCLHRFDIHYSRQKGTTFSNKILQRKQIWIFGEPLSIPRNNLFAWHFHIQALTLSFVFLFCAFVSEVRGNLRSLFLCYRIYFYCKRLNTSSGSTSKMSLFVQKDLTRLQVKHYVSRSPIER